MTAAICPRCSTPVPEGGRFCTTCGHDVSGEHAGHEATLVSQSDPELQARLQTELGDEYALERELGHGGMAVVFLARDVHLGRHVAVKVLPPELTYGSAGAVERFKREARTAATLDHPNIIPVHRVSTGGKLCWYVMKFLEGESLDHILEREGTLSPERTVAIVNQVADALGYAHDHGVVHRDIKPANVMLDARGRVTVTDFGIAKALSAETLTASGSMIGTPYYMSPEQCTGKKEITGASDQYSLGIMVYQMLGGHVPFQGDSVVDIAKQHCMDPVPPLVVLRPELPRDMPAVVERALAKASGDRYPTVMEFASELAKASRGEAIALPPRAVALPETLVVTPAIDRRPGAVSAETKRRRRTPVVIGGVVTVIAAAGVLAVTQPWRAAGGAAGDSAAVDTMQRAAPGTLPPVVPPTAGDTARPAVEGSRGGVTRPGTERPAGRDTVTRAATEPRRAQDTVTTTRPTNAATGFISVGARANAAITINGRSVSNPVSQFEVPAGRVTIVFTVTDSTGQWPWDTTVTVPAGQHVNLRYLRPVRR